VIEADLGLLGNRFEFRAVGSSQNIGFPLAVLNTAVADGLDTISSKIEAGASPRDAVASVLADNWHGVFNGNGYSDEWQVEAASRGLLNLKDTPAAWRLFDLPKNIELFKKHKVFTEDETRARKSIALDGYAMHIEIEGNALLKMLDSQVVPSLCWDLETYSNFDAGLDRRSLYTQVAAGTNALRDVLAKIPEGEQEAADFCAKHVRPAMDSVRAVTDQAENLCEDWPYPSYQDLVFNHQNEAPHA
jgi:glutamine synthetase